MPAKQNDGRIAQAELVAAQPIHIAWGTGNPAWDAAPEPEPNNATALVAEIGRRAATQVAFVNPDPAGAIETPQGNFSLSETPTRHLYVRVVFAFNEASDARIRELGVFIDTQVADGLPAGQRYFTPDQIVQPGRLYLLDRSQNFQRNGAVRPAFDYVFPF
jgi:hypothetical protein